MDVQIYTNNISKHLTAGVKQTCTQHACMPHAFYKREHLISACCFSPRKDNEIYWPRGQTTDRPCRRDVSVLLVEFYMEAGKRAAARSQ